MLPFQFLIYFMSFSCLIAIAKTLNTERGEWVVSFLILEEIVSVSPFNIMLAIGLLYIDLIILKCVPSIPKVPRTFIRKAC